MPRCLVTGASGFIGPRLVQVLQAAGGEVRCLVRQSSSTAPLESLGAELVRGDVTDTASLAGAVQGVDFVFHLAGRTAARSYEQFAEVNERGAANVAAACAAESDPPVLILVSSLAAAGPSRGESPVTEGDTPEPISNYGRSKLAGELAVREWAAEVPTSIVRPPVVFGPGDRAGLVIARGIAKTGLHVVHRPGLPLSLVHADDLAEALLLVARYGERLDPTDPRSAGVYYAADPEPSSYADMGRMIAGAMGTRVRIVKLRRWALATAAGVSETVARVRGREPLLAYDKFREGTAPGWVASAAKLISQTGFTPSKPLAEHYHDTVAWYRGAGWLEK